MGKRYLMVMCRECLKILFMLAYSANNIGFLSFTGFYKYGGKSFKASAYPSGASLSECRSTALQALRANESSCTYMKCTFGGIWNGGGGDGQENLFVASFFFDRAAEVL